MSILPKGSCPLNKFVFIYLTTILTKDVVLKHVYKQSSVIML